MLVLNRMETVTPGTEQITPTAAVDGHCLPPAMSTNRRTLYCYEYELQNVVPGDITSSDPITSVRVVFRLNRRSAHTQCPSWFLILGRYSEKIKNENNRKFTGQNKTAHSRLSRRMPSYPVVRYHNHNTSEGLKLNQEARTKSQACM